MKKHKQWGHIHLHWDAAGLSEVLKSSRLNTIYEKSNFKVVKGGLV